jgi:hypothetical protein
MSLFSLEEICKGCIHSKWHKDKFMDCAKDNEYAVNAINGTCDTKLELMKEPEKEEIKVKEDQSWYLWLEARIPDLKATGAYKTWIKLALNGYKTGTPFYEIETTEQKIESLTKENADLRDEKESWINHTKEIEAGRDVDRESMKIIRSKNTNLIQQISKLTEELKSSREETMRLLRENSKYNRLRGEFKGTLEGILFWDIPAELKVKIEKQLEEISLPSPPKE